jgi:hypothetical protein
MGSWETHTKHMIGVCIVQNVEYNRSVHMGVTIMLCCSSNRCNRNPHGKKIL